MPELYKSMFFGLNNKILIFHCMFFWHPAPSIESMLPLDGFAYDYESF